MVKINKLRFFRIGTHLLLSLIVGLWMPSSAMSQTGVATEADLLPLLREIIAEAYPELKDISLSMGRFSESDSFFQSNFELHSLFSEQPIYRIEVNPRIWQLSLPPLALKAVLAHELAHTRDYHLGQSAGVNRVQNVLCVLNQLRLYESLRSYEHRTDLQAIFRGYGPGLKQYREWLYPLLNAEALLRKQEVYYTPAEIDALMQALNSSKNAGKQTELMHFWLEKVPLNLVEIQMGIKHFGLAGS